MPAIGLELKEYQQAALGRFRSYLEKAVKFNARTAFVLHADRARI